MPEIRYRFVVVRLSIALAVFGVACIDPKCPKGYDQKGDRCYRIRDAGLDAGVADGDAEAAGAGSEPEDPEDDASLDHATTMDAGSSATDAAEDPCEPSPCEHGGTCSRIGEEFVCDCAGTGFEGATCEHDIDECAAPNSCTSSDYPCVQTEPPGYTCLGQYADWPMPDAVAGSKAKPSYAVTSSPETVFDQVTGLVWQRYLPAVYAGCTATTDVAGGSCSWQEAKDYCGALVLGGFSDWRLPSKIELESIVDDTRSAPPALDIVAFPDVPSSSSGDAWSSSPSQSGTQPVAYVVQATGGTLAAPIQLPSGTSGVRVRCVRGPRVASGTPDTRYQIGLHGVATVTDTRTGLTWQRDIDANSYTRRAAVAHCDGLGPGWRLPTKKELLTLIDPVRLLDWVRARSEGAIDRTVFPGIPALVPFWSVSPTAVQLDGEARYWAVQGGIVPIALPESELARAWCVR